MDIKDCIISRRSIRKFKPDAVSSEDIKSIIETATYAPSWKNSQVVRYYAVSAEDVKKEIIDLLPDLNKPAATLAPVIIVTTVIKNRSGYNRQGEAETKKGSGWQMYDCGMSNLLVCLAANDIGLGTVVMGYFDETAIGRLLEIPEAEEVSSVIAMGYPDETPMMPKRKGIDIVLKEII